MATERKQYLSRVLMCSVCDTNKAEYTLTTELLMRDGSTAETETYICYDCAKEMGYEPET